MPARSQLTVGVVGVLVCIVLRDVVMFSKNDTPRQPVYHLLASQAETQETLDAIAAYQAANSIAPTSTPFPPSTGSSCACPAISRGAMAASGSGLINRERSSAWKPPAAQVTPVVCDPASEPTAKPMLLMGTTSKEPSETSCGGEHKFSCLDIFDRQVQANTLQGLLSQGTPGKVLPVVFTKSPSWGEEIKKHMAKYGEVTYSDQFGTRFDRTDRSGFPLFRDMMATAERRAIADGIRFYGYTNGDIIFAEDLTLTLEHISTAMDAGFFEAHYITQKEHETTGHKPMMIIGRRTNFQFDRPAPGAGSNEKLFYGLFDRSNTCAVSHDFLLMAAEGELMPEYAVDYFIFTAGAIDWSNFPEYLVGNVAYDQAVIGHARRAGTVVIDTTNTIHAFHQTGNDGNQAGHDRHPRVKQHNEILWAQDGFSKGMRKRPGGDDKVLRPHTCVDITCFTHSTMFTPDFKLAIATKPDDHLSKDKLPEEQAFFYSSCGAAARFLKGEERFPLVSEALDFALLLHVVQVCSN
eukprot:COSAG02_NODE_2485_length_8709_cov_23.301394_5_plen_522_part_00